MNIFFSLCEFFESNFFFRFVLDGFCATLPSLPVALPSPFPHRQSFLSACLLERRSTWLAVLHCPSPCRATTRDGHANMPWRRLVAPCFLLRFVRACARLLPRLCSGFVLSFFSVRPAAFFEFRSKLFCDACIDLPFFNWICFFSR